MRGKQRTTVTITVIVAIGAVWVLADRRVPSPSQRPTSAPAEAEPARRTSLADPRATTSVDACPEAEPEQLAAANLFVPVDGPDGPLGFATPLTDDPSTELRAFLPSRGEQPIRFGVGPTGEIGVRNLGMYGPGRAEGSAVVYDTELGASYWSSFGGGVEEWLRIDTPRDGIVAQYELDGASFVATATGVSVRDHEGVAWLDVKAPAARDAEGRKVEVWLEVVDERLAVVIDAPEDAVGPLMVDPLWSIVEQISKGLDLHSATRLLDGRVLVAGGIDEANLVSDMATIFEPGAGIWSLAGSLPAPVRSHAQVLLDDGRVLLSHGSGSANKAVLYDPLDESWAIADPARANIGGPGTRLGSRVTRLPDGNILLTGASCCPGVEAHVYDPIEDEFHAIASMNVVRLAHSLTVLPDGSVLAAGGGTLNATGLNSNTAELYVPDMLADQPYLNGSWVQLPNMNAGHMDHQAVLLEEGPNAGKVLICAGLDGATKPGSFSFTTTCDLYNPDTETFELAAAIPHGRQRGGTNNGGDFLARVESGPSIGKVVVAGGWPATQHTDVYDSFTNTWTTMCKLAQPRLRHTTTALLDGSVLVVGGQAGPNTQALRSVERLYLGLDDDDCDGISNAADICPFGGCGQVTGSVVFDENQDCDPSGESGVGGVQIRASRAGETRYAVTNFEGQYLLELPSDDWEISVVDSQTIEEEAICGGPELVEAFEVWPGQQQGPVFLMHHECDGSLAMFARTLSETGGCNGGLPYRSPCPGSRWEYCVDAFNAGAGWSAGPPPGTLLTVLLPEGMVYTGFNDPNACTFTEQSAVFDGTQWEVVFDLGGTGNGKLCQVCAEVDVVSLPVGGWHASATLEAKCGGSATFDATANTSTTHACSCDPNDKGVYPAGCDEAGTISAQPLTYTLRFQNTGSGPAHEVRLVDPIDVDLNLESLVLRGASHPISNIQVDSDGSLFVTFDGIELPAMIDDPLGSSGYIQFDLTPAEWSVDTQYTNLAEIYFDQNDVVITNEVINTVGVCPLPPSHGGSSHSGLGDGTNPGQGQGQGHSPNGGGNNPNHAP